MKTTARIITTLALASSALAGCSFHARSPDKYRDATQEVLLTRQNEIKACYDAALAKDKTVAGLVKVDFKVEKETGRIVDPTVDADGTTAPSELGDCIVQSLNGLTLDPPDAREGHASFTYEFKANG